MNVFIFCCTISNLENKKGKYKYDQEVYEIFTDSFDMMPISCILNGKFIAFHGGISPDLKTV